MTRIRHKMNGLLAEQTRRAALDSVPHVDANAVGRICTANDYCTCKPVPNCPVPLCAAHLAEVYQFAADLVTKRAGFIWQTSSPDF